MTVDRCLLHDRIAGHFLPNPPKRIGVAVSGGSDSLSLLILLHAWRDQGGPEVFAITVDHGLRSEAAAEAAYVAEICDTRAIPHEIRRWQGWNGQGNLQAQARLARYGLIADWAKDRQVDKVALGHTADDQAETFLMRLSREAGVDGLSAMASQRQHEGVEFVRPALKITREELRENLRQENVDWIEDPSNDDEAFDRVRARKALGELAALGISIQTLSAVAHNMADVRRTLYWYAFLAARNFVTFQTGDLVIERKGFRTLQLEIGRRLMQQALRWVSGAEYVPRGRAIDLLLESIRGGTDMTLQGCFISMTADDIRITRESASVADLRVEAGQVWDGRWRLIGPAVAGGEIGALGKEGLSLCGDWRASGLPAASLRSSPAVWQQGSVIAAPLVGYGVGWRFELVRDEDHFFASLLSH